jgi:hypothetical protein
VRGYNDEYPLQVLAAQWNEVARRMAVMANDTGNPEEWDVHHWQEINPVHTEALVQLTCGGPQIIYHGGLLHTSFRWFCADTRRPGLPKDCAVLVSRIDGDTVTLTAANTSVSAHRRLVGLAGAFGEHRIARISHLEGEKAQVSAASETDTSTLEVALPPSTSVSLSVTLDRYRNTPSYDVPV